MMIWSGCFLLQVQFYCRRAEICFLYAVACQSLKTCYFFTKMLNKKLIMFLYCFKRTRLYKVLLLVCCLDDSVKLCF